MRRQLRGVLVGLVISTAAIAGPLAGGAAHASTDASQPGGPRPTVTMTIGEAVAGRPTTITLDVRGARIRQARLLVDGARVSSPPVISGRTARFVVTWPVEGDHELAAVVVTPRNRVLRSWGGVYVSQPAPERNRYQLVYLYPDGTNPVPGRAEAIAAEAGVADRWFGGQMGGLSPRFATGADGQPSVVVVRSRLNPDAMAAEADVVVGSLQQWYSDGTIAADAVPIVYVESRQSAASQGACGWWSGGGTEGHITIPMANCGIYPAVGGSFPYGGTYLLVHEMTHALGGVSRSAPHSDGTGHTTDDPRDVIGAGARDWSNLMLDPGRDDYYLTGRSDLVNIEMSPFIEGRP